MERRLSPPLLLCTISALGILSTTACEPEVSGPSPQVESLSPSLVCSEQLVTEVQIAGESLSPLSIDSATDDPHLAIPDVTLQRLEDLEGNAVSGDATLLANDPLDPDAARVSWLSSTSMSFEVYPELGLESGLYQITVANRNGNQATLDAALAVVPPPTVASVEPDLVCVEQDMRTLTITGTGFLSVSGGDGDALPTVRIDGDNFQADSVEGDCTPITTTNTTAQMCTTLTVTVPAGSIPTGEHTVVVENPAPAGCSSTEEVTLFVAEPPVIEAVAPPAVCSTDQPATMDLTGSGFLRISEGDAAWSEPEVVIDGVVTAGTFGDCTPFAGATVSGEVCTTFTFDVPAGGFDLGSHTVVVTNPAPAGCSSSAMFDVAEAPEVAEVTPFKVCADGDVFTVAGAGFVSGSEIILDPGTEPTPITTTYVSPTELQGEVSSPPIALGDHSLVVSNGMSCQSLEVDPAIRVVAAPVVFFVDPPNVYNQIDMRVTVYASGIESATPQVGIRPTGTTDPLIQLPNPSYAGGNRIQADLPAGMVAAGDYDVVIVDEPCQAELANILHVTDTLGVHVASIEPPFTGEGERTGVTIRSLDPNPSGLATFAATPRAYLTPVGGGVATELRAVSYLDSVTLSAVVPDTLPPGEYQVLVINPDGGVGLLSPEVFTVLPDTDPPPVVTDLVPGFVTEDPASAVQIVGRNFPTSATDVAVTAECRDQSLTPGPDVSLSATLVGDPTATAIDATWDTQGLAGYVCVVRVTNLLNSAYVDFSAFSVSNAAGNINSFVPAPDMIEPRRALAAAALRMNQESRYLFAIGGDQGDDGTNPITRHSSVEYAPVNPFGEFAGGFTLQRNALPEGRAYTAATVIDRHVYVAGGRVGAPGAGVVDNTVYRAYLLDPFEAPVIDDIGLTPGEGAGLDGGIWYYRVAAIMDDGTVATADPNNPGGEGLPSEPLVIQLPQLDGKVQLTLYWDAIPNAAKYVIYRTTQPDQISGDEVFLAEIDHVAGAAVQSFTDDGTIDNAAETRTPMPLGSLGVWHQVGTLNVEREGAGLVAVPDPVDPTAHYLYVIGGRDATQAALDTYEWVKVTAPASNQQTLDAAGFQVGAALLPDARWLLGAVYVNDKRATAVTGNDVWVYALPGETGAGAAVARNTAFLVDVADGVDDGVGGVDDGSLSAPTDVAAPAPRFTGYGYVAGNNYLHLLGGQTGAPSTSGMESLISGSPDLDLWNAGTSLSTPRHLLGVANESSFIYLLGGRTDAEIATRSTERTNF